MPSIDKFTIDLGFDNAKLKQSVNQASKTIDDFTKDVSSKLTNVFKTLSTVIGADFIKNMVQGFTQTASQLGFLSQTLGESVTTLSTWHQAVIRAGGSASQFDATLGSIRSKLQEARYLGNANLAGYFNYLGISALDGTGKLKKSTDVLLDVAQKLQGRSLSQQQFLGHALGIDDATLRILIKGKKATEELLQSVKQYGVITKQQAEDAIKYKNAQANLNQVWENSKAIVADSLLPYLIKFTNWFADFTNGIREHKDVLIGAFTAIGAVLAYIALTNPWTYIIAGIISLVYWIGILYDDYEHFKKFGKKFSEFDWSSIVKFIGYVKELLHVIIKIGEFFGLTKTKVLLIGTALLALIPIFSLLKTAVSLFGVALDISLGPLGLILAATGLILANWKAIKAEAQGVVAGVQNSKGVGDVLDAVINKPLKDLGDFIIGKGFLPALQAIGAISPEERANFQSLLNTPIASYPVSHTSQVQSNSQVTNVHAQNINLPAVKNPSDFVSHWNNINSPNVTSWQFSSGRAL